MSALIIGNIIALIASFLMIYYSILKEKKEILIVQSIKIGLLALSNIILGGITGAIVNIIGLIRNIICYKNKLGLKEKIIISLLNIILTLMFNNLGFIGLLPLASTVIYVWLMNTKDVKKFKLLIASTMVLWLIYDITIKSYTSAIFDFLTVIANIVTLIQIKNKEKKKEKIKPIKK